MTANPQRVKEYLQRHAIGALFEEMMGKIIVEMPEEPMLYLISMLNIKIEQAGDSSHVLRHSASPVRSRPIDQGDAMRKTTPAASSPDAMRKTAFTASADWTQETGKARQYDRPWTAHSKRPKPKKTEGDLEPKMARTIGARPDWDGHTKVQGTGFDELWEDSGATSQKLQIKAMSMKELANPTSVAKRAIMDETTMNDWVKAATIARRNAGRLTEEELLANEAPMSHRQAMTASDDNQPPAPQEMVSHILLHKKGPHGHHMHHRHTASEHLVAENKSDADSGYHDDNSRDHLVHDEAVELYENLEDLRREGVDVSKMSQQSRRSRHAVVHRTPLVACELKVGICARCASPCLCNMYSIIEGGLPSATFGTMSSVHDQRATTAVAADLFDTNVTTASRPATARSMPSRGPFESDDEDDDDEFESVSQVTGPRHPVWNDSDNEASNGTKTRTVSASMKSLPAPRSTEFGADATGGKRPPSRPSSAVGLTGGRVNKPGGSSADIEHQDEDRRNSLSRVGLSGSAWQVHDGNDTDDSTTYVTGENQTKKKSVKPRVY